MPDSKTNTKRMSLFCAPTAFITPISFVLSSTAVYIVFIILTVATKMDIRAIRKRLPLIIFRMLPKVCRASSNVITKKSSLPSSWPLNFLSLSSILFVSASMFVFLYALPITKAYLSFVLGYRNSIISGMTYAWESSSGLPTSS